MSTFPDELSYTKDHEWTTKPNNGSDTVTIGISDHAQEALGEIVYVELPEVGKELKQKDTFGVVESIKAVSDLYSPVEGTVVEVNQNVADNPGTINSDCYKDGWIIKVKLTNQEAFETLMDSAKYKEYVDGLA